MKIGIIREGKTPPDKRVPLTPKQCKFLLEKYPKLAIAVQSSEIRAFDDDEYREAGLKVVSELSDCDVLMGVKEVPESELIAGKTYLFFSHTFKEQPYNRDLLRTIIEKKIRLIDYEVMTNQKGIRLIGFGRYAGIVGCYNAFLAVGKRLGSYDLKPAHECLDKKEVEHELKQVELPKGFKIAITGAGRVAGGAMEILKVAGIKKVSPKEYLSEGEGDANYTQLTVLDYNKPKSGVKATKTEFYNHPDRFDSDFMKYAKHTDLYIPCHYWDSRAPYLFTREDARQPEFNVQVVADISCDIDGPVASTLRPSTIADPLYGYDPVRETEVAFNDLGAIGVMAVDNLPCELPRDASEDFGNELVKNILPALIGDDEQGIIKRATETTLRGELAENFTYLSDYLKG